MNDLTPEQQTEVQAAVDQSLNRYTGGLDRVNQLLDTDDFSRALQELEELAQDDTCQPCTEAITALRTKVTDTQDVCSQKPWLAGCVRKGLTDQVLATRRLFEEPEEEADAPEK